MSKDYIEEVCICTDDSHTGEATCHCKADECKCDPAGCCDDGVCVMEDCNCDKEGCCDERVHVKADHWAHLQVHLEKAASDVHDAVTKGVANAEPVFREKVAPALSDATAKLAEYAETARKATSEKAGIDDADKPVSQIGTGLAAIASGLLGLSKSLAEWVSEHAANAAAAEPKVKVDDLKVDEVRVPVDDDVAAVADLLQQPVVVEDGATRVVEPN